MAKFTKFDDFLPAMTMSMQRPPAVYVRIISGLIMVFVLITLLWLIFAKVDIIVSAQGKLVPSGNIKVVQAADAGVVRKIYVQNGQLVRAGDTLIDFDSTVSLAELTQLKRYYQGAQLTSQRLRIATGETLDLGAGVDNKRLVNSERSLLKAADDQLNEEVKLLRIDRDQAKAARDIARRELVKLEGEIEFSRTQAEQSKRHASDGLVARSEADKAEFTLQNNLKEYEVQQQRVVEASNKYSAARERLNAKHAEHHNDLLQSLSKANSDLEEARRNYVRAQQQMRHQSLRAPIDGFVQQLSVHTIGAVVSRTDQLLVIVPEDAVLEVEAHVLNKDIGFVDRSQPANVKIDAFEYTRYGSLKGEIEWIASDAVLDKDRGPIYPVRLGLESTQLPRKVNNRTAEALAGMSVTADVVIGQRRLIEYFIGPILRYRDESLNER